MGGCCRPCRGCKAKSVIIVEEGGNLNTTNSNNSHARHAWLTHYKWLIAICIIAVLLRLVVAAYMGNEIGSLPGIDDQHSYNMLADRVLHGFGFTVAYEWWPLTHAGKPTAHWSYLYTLYLIVVYGLFGQAPLLARVIQVVLGGVLWPVLTYRVARKIMGGSEETPTATRSHGEVVALIAAAWSACYGYFVYYGAALLTETFYITALLWTFDLTLGLANSLKFGKPIQFKRTWLLLGLAIGIAILLRQLFMFFVPFLLLWLAWAARPVGMTWKAHLPRIIKGAVLMGLIIIALIAPWTILNYRNFHQFVLLNTNAGYAFFFANHPIYGTHFIDILPNETYLSLVPDSLRQLNEPTMGDALMKLSVQQILADPLRYVLLSLSRFETYFMFWPAPDSGLISNLTRVGSFGVALPFMLFGVWRSLKQWRRWSLIYLFVLVYAGIHLLSWALVRYRLPIDALALIFASVALVELVNVVRKRVLPRQTETLQQVKI